ncbi:MAG: tRNA (adenine-N1)-methyltransferase [Aigarchaeota archaeon]|nr:tRNA (adenine-N1)-methyltransferase [Aigarchaeota archaeon]MDW8093260.1 tRNA (adenine-N1)-methyltransferase [Nitrososphaerota archaeon]
MSPLEGLRYGTRVVLVTEGGKRYRFTLREGARIHTSEGYFECDDIVRGGSGALVTSNTGRRAVAFEPLFVDRLLFVPRRTQIVYPKDLGFILVTSSISDGSKVIEAGTGSGVLALALANYVRPTGHVYSYDLTDENFENVMTQARALNLQEVITLKVGDVTEKVDETDADAFILDIPEPWRAVKTVKAALKPGAVFIAVVPTVNQLERTLEALRSEGFMDYVSGELYFRSWRVREGMTRPHHLMRSHTVYLIVSRKTLCEDLSSWRIELPDGYS